MDDQVLTNWLILVFVFLVFVPYLSKAVRLGTKTWSERENLPKDQVRNVVFMTPIAILFGFILFYLFATFLIGVFVF